MRLSGRAGFLMCLVLALALCPQAARAMAERVVLLHAPGLSAQDVLDETGPFAAFSASATVGVISPTALVPGLTSLSALAPVDCALAPHLSLPTPQNSALAGRLWGVGLTASEALLTNLAPLREQCHPNVGALMDRLNKTGVRGALLADLTCLGNHPPLALLVTGEGPWLESAQTKRDFTLPQPGDPCGRRLNTRAFADAVRQALTRHRWVVAETGVLARLHQELSHVAPDRRAPQRRAALAQAAALVDRLWRDLGEEADVLLVSMGHGGQPGVALGLGPDFRKGGLLTAPGQAPGVTRPGDLGALVLQLFSIPLHPNDQAAAPVMAKPAQGANPAPAQLRGFLDHQARRAALTRRATPWLAGALVAGLWLLWVCSHAPFGARGAAGLGNLGAFLLGCWPALCATGAVGHWLGWWPWLGAATLVSLCALGLALGAFRRLSGVLVVLGVLGLALALMDTLPPRLPGQLAPLAWPPSPFLPAPAHPLLAGLGLGGALCGAALPGEGTSRPNVLAGAFGGLLLLLSLLLWPAPLGHQPLLGALGLWLGLVALLAQNQRLTGWGEGVAVALAGAGLAALGMTRQPPAPPWPDIWAQMTQGPWPAVWLTLATLWWLLLKRRAELARLWQTHPALVAGGLAALPAGAAALVFTPGGVLATLGLWLLPLGALLAALGGLAKSTPGGGDANFQPKQH